MGAVGDRAISTIPAASVEWGVDQVQPATKSRLDLVGQLGELVESPCRTTSFMPRRYGTDGRRVPRSGRRSRGYHRLVSTWGRAKQAVRRRLYPAYEARVVKSLPRDQIPKHVGVMLDGNRRWAKAVGRDTAHGHRTGAANIEPLLDWCEEVGVEVVTLWLLSTDNLNRQARGARAAARDHRRGGAHAGGAAAVAAAPGRGARPAALRDVPRSSRPPTARATSTGCSSTSPSGTAAAGRSPTRSGRCWSSTPRRAPASRSWPRSSTSSTSPTTSTPRASPTPTS